MTMLRPLHVWALNKDGSVKRDSHGFRVPHAKKGQAKKESELTAADRKVMARQLADQERRNLANEKQARTEAFFEAALKAKI